MYIVLFLVWLLFNNYYAFDYKFLEIVLFGLFVCALVYIFIITLTPGTITLSLQRDKLIVHTLKKEYIEGFENSRLVRIAKRMEATK